jgi:chromosome segregation ATPase
MAVDSPRARTERALAELVAAEGPRAVTVARIRAAARVDQSVAADVVREWRGTQRVGATDEVAAPATEDEARAFEALRAIIRQAVLAERAKQDDAVNQAASAAAEEAEEARQEATLLAEKLEKEKATTAEQTTTIAALKAELAAAAAEADRLREELAQQREAAGAAREEAAEARGKLFVYEQQATAQAAQAAEAPVQAQDKDHSAAPATTGGQTKA